MEPELLRVATVAKLLAVSRKRVYQMVQEGAVESVRLGPRILRVPRASVLQFIEKGKAANREELGLDLLPGARPPAQRIRNRRGGY